MEYSCPSVALRDGFKSLPLNGIGCAYNLCLRRPHGRVGAHTSQHSFGFSLVLGMWQIQVLQFDSFWDFLPQNICDLWAAEFADLKRTGVEGLLYSTAFLKGELLVQTTTWTKLRDVMLSEIRRTQRSIYRMNPYM